MSSSSSSSSNNGDRARGIRPEDVQTLEPNDNRSVHTLDQPVIRLETANTHQSKDDVVELQEVSRREKLKRHRVEVAGQVGIPETWGKEELLKDWMDCSAFEACLVPNGIISARASLVEDGRRLSSSAFNAEIMSGRTSLVEEGPRKSSSAFDSSLVVSGILSARASLVEEGRRTSSSGGLRIESSCSI